MAYLIYFLFACSVLAMTPSSVLVSALDPVLEEVAFNRLAVIQRNKNSLLSQTEMIRKTSNAEKEADMLASVLYDGKTRLVPGFADKLTSAQTLKMEKRIQLRSNYGINFKTNQRAQDLRLVRDHKGEMKYIVPKQLQASSPIISPSKPPPFQHSSYQAALKSRINK